MNIFGMKANQNIDFQTNHTPKTILQTKISLLAMRSLIAIEMNQMLGVFLPLLQRRAAQFLKNPLYTPDYVKNAVKRTNQSNRFLTIKKVCIPFRATEKICTVSEKCISVPKKPPRSPHRNGIVLEEGNLSARQLFRLSRKIYPCSL